MVKRKIIWSARAKSDLLGILNFFYKRNESKVYSLKLNRTIRDSIRLLTKHPDLGIQTEIPNVRNLIEDNYFIFYEVNSDYVEIITIWDCRQDPENRRFK